VKTGSIGIPFIAPLPWRTGILHRCVEETLVFTDEVDHIHSETITALVQPESHNVVHSIADGWVLPVQIGLFCRIKVEVVLFGELIPLPSAPLSD
jgi:hypothetical protein